MLGTTESNALIKLAQNDRVCSLPIQRLQLTRRCVIVADTHGIIYLFCRETLTKLKTLNQRAVQCWSPNYGFFPVNLVFTAMNDSCVLFTCDEINSFGLWNTVTEKVHTFPGQILHNEKTVQLIPLGNYFLLISQDMCFNIIVDLYRLQDNLCVKLLGCIGFLTRQVDFQLKSVDLSIIHSPSVQKGQINRSAALVINCSRQSNASHYITNEV